MCATARMPSSSFYSCTPREHQQLSHCLKLIDFLSFWQGLVSFCAFNYISFCHLCLTAGGDVRPPTISNCPAGAITALAAASSTGASVSWTAPTATDESGSVSSTSDYTPGAFFPIGTTTVTYTFTDPAGNEARCLFNVIVTGRSQTSVLFVHSHQMNN